MASVKVAGSVGSDPTSLLPWKRWRLNAFMCTYIGVCHVVALHSILVLALWGGQDKLLGWGDQIIKGATKDALVFLCGEHCTDIMGSGLVQVLTRTESVSPVKAGTLWFAFALWPISSLGVTAGAHRLWAHKSYECHSVVKLALMLANSIASQGSIFHWARDHRTHHLHSDTIADPHNPSRGWFYSHVGWLLVQKPCEVVAAGRKLDCSDLRKDPLVMFQKRADPWWNLAWCFAVPAFACVYMFGDTLWNGFLYAGVLRYVYVLHCTWSVNSIVHAFGPSPYDPTESPAESRLVSWLAIGEGWHSWHHAFAFDYAAAELGALQQWNPTKVFLDALAVVGLVWGRKRGHRMWCERKRRMVESAAQEGLTMVEKLSGPPMWKVRDIRWYNEHGEEVAVEGRGEGAGPQIFLVGPHR